MNNEFYTLNAKSITGELIEMEKYKNKVLLIVNTASKCGFTPQFAGLEELNKKYKDAGLEILGFPCNQFGNQEPGSEKDIADNCLINYGVTFPMFSKINVNGDDAHPIFKYLKEKLKGTLGKDIKWNFTKFLIDRNGNPVKRFASVTKPEKLASDIEKLL
ncbi:MAG: glutathione peroxidase [Ignavibacteriae bacterium]|nr:glutathione peroxidase [Ignavibacteriota bacterium]NOG97808.1 glutathione peroxidase [Ignavibacteriota bacterium]